MDDPFERPLIEQPPNGQPAPIDAAPTDAAPINPAPAVDAEADVLDGLEQDLAAVEEAMQTLDRITADAVGGDAAAGQIVSVVSPERFPDGAPVVQVDLTEA